MLIVAGSFCGVHGLVGVTDKYFAILAVTHNDHYAWACILECIRSDFVVTIYQYDTWMLEMVVVEANITR